MCIIICIYIYIYICPACLVSRSPPPKVRVPQDGLPQRVEYACQASICMHMHAYAFICMSICICISTSTYACIAYACKHRRAWHVCTYICLHGMHAYMQASCHVHPHPTPTGGGRISPWVGPVRGISYGHFHCPPHIPQGGGGSITITTPYPLVGGGGEPLAPRTYIYIYIYICIYA